MAEVAVSGLTQRLQRTTGIDRIIHYSTFLLTAAVCLYLAEDIISLHLEGCTQSIEAATSDVDCSTVIAVGGWQRYIIGKREVCYLSAVNHHLKFGLCHINSDTLCCRAFQFKLIRPLVVIGNLFVPTVADICCQRRGYD